MQDDLGLPTIEELEAVRCAAGPLTWAEVAFAVRVYRATQMRASGSYWYDIARACRYNTSSAAASAVLKVVPQLRRYVSRRRHPKAC